MNFTLYPIYWVADAADDEPFDHRKLPFHVIDGVHIEDISGRFNKGSFDIFREHLASGVVRNLGEVRYALVDRYVVRPGTLDGEYLDDAAWKKRSKQTVEKLAACLRLIRPMRQRVLTIWGDINHDEKFNVEGFDVPVVELIEVPEVQKHFMLRNRDAEDLRTYAPEFLRAMSGEFWKFRMAVQFHDLGHFQPLDWKARYLLWCSAIEAMYTTDKNKGSAIAISRIKFFLGENTSIYPPGDIPSLLTDPQIAVGQIVPDLYTLRNLMAHGNKIADRFFNDTPRVGFNGGVPTWMVLLEAASFVIRTSLLRILRDNLLNNFANAFSADAFFPAPKFPRVQHKRRP